MSIAKQIIYYDTDTGEEIKCTSANEMVEPKIPFKATHRFSKAYHIKKPSFTNKTYYYYFYECIASLEQGTNRLVYFGNSFKDNIPINMTEFAKVCGVSRKTASGFFKECVEKKYIRRLDLDGEFLGYFVNPIYVFNGKYICGILYSMFKDCGLSDHMGDQCFRMEEYEKVHGLDRMVNNTYKKNKINEVEYIEKESNSIKK